MDGRSRRWAAHNQAQRRRIVDAAVALHDAGHPDPTLRQIGDRAGVSRSAVYRQFENRNDLDTAVRQRILNLLWAELSPTFELRGTPWQALRRIAAAYVGWAAAHPHLHRLADLDTAVDAPLQLAIDQVSETVAGLLVTWFTSAGAEVTEADRAATDPLVHGLVGAVFATVRRWVHLGSEVPATEQLTELVVESAWAVIETRARAYGLVIEPDVPLTDQLPTG